MKRRPLRWAWAVVLTVPVAQAGGVSAYLPLNLDPRIERQVERVLVLAGKPVLKRPIPIAWVRAALPKACAADLVTCRDVETYLERVAGDATSAQTSIEGAASDHTNRTVPNRYGLDGTSPWVATAALTWQPRPYLLASAGAVAYDGEANPTGSMLSVGFDRAQLDLGYRPHWFSPMSDSSMLISTEAPTMPSATLSNVVPLTRVGFGYELFMAEMSQSDRIAFRGGFTSGKPRLAGVHLSMEPASGWALGVNRLMQYGGGARGHQSLHDLVNAFFNPGSFDNVSGANLDNQFGNQVASVTSRFLFPGKTPFAVYFEYAGEDTSRGRSYLLGNAALSMGLHFPRLGGRFDLTLEASEWQNGWYTNALYGDGLSNRGHVIGNWVGDMRRFGDDVGGQSAMARLAWDLQEGADLALQYRTLHNESYTGGNYRRAQEFSMTYSRPWGDSLTAGARLEAGRDVFGDSFGRLAGFLRFTEGAAGGSALPESDAVASAEGAALFVEAGASSNRVRIDLQDGIPVVTRNSTSPHLGIGARRAVSRRSDLGARLELDRVDGHLLLAVRALDYRFRFAGPLALTGFLGAARYDLATPAFGFYGGSGLQWRDIAPGWDLNLDGRYAIKVARDHLLPGDPAGVRPDSFYDIYGAALYLTKRY